MAWSIPQERDVLMIPVCASPADLDSPLHTIRNVHVLHYISDDASLDTQ
jgi:hypothetical protein